MGTHRHANQNIQKRGVKVALISIKDVKQAIKVMMEILAVLDKIYHALENNTADKSE